jgi:large subunit ribosomal protein L25
MELKVQNRKRTGRKVKSLRKEGLVPAVVFGKETESINLKLNAIEFLKAYRQAGETEIIDLKVEDDKKEYPVLIDEVQIDPVTEDIIHVNFRLVDLSKPIRVHIPIEYTGSENHPLIKNGTAILLTQFDEIEIEVSPRNLPKEFEINIEPLKEVGDVLTIKDLKSVIDTEKITILEEDEEMVIASLDYAIQPELEVEEEVSEEEMIAGIETTGESEDKEGEEGEDKKESGEKPESQPEEKKE